MNVHRAFFAASLALSCGIHAQQGPVTLPAPPSPPVPQTLASAIKRIEELENFVIELSVEVQNLRYAAADLKAETSSLRQLTDALAASAVPEVPVPTIAEIDPYDTKKYSPVWASNGLVLLVSVESAGPYLAGSKLELKIGNPSSASITGFTVHILRKDQRSSSPFTFTANLLAGAWTPVTVVMPDVPPEKMGKMDLSIQVSTVSFR